MSNLTSKELKQLLDDCSSVKKEIKLADGRKKYIWKQRAILNSDGNPVSLENFMQRERIMAKPIKIDRNSREEIKEAKEQYSNYMLKKFGKNWRKEIKGATVKLYTFRQLRMLI